MNWKEFKIPIIIDKNNPSKIIKSIPSDLFHLEFDSINKIEDHRPGQYLYILTDNLSLYKDEDTVKYFNYFFIKDSNNELVRTNYKFTDYITR
jgi:hypothetical protein